MSSLVQRITALRCLLARSGAASLWLILVWLAAVLGIAAPTMAAAAAPVVSEVYFNSGPLAGRTTRIIGSGFSDATAVKFGTKSATFTVMGDTEIQAISPSATAGVVDVRVTTADGTSAVSAASKYTYLEGPVVTGVSPNSGLANGNFTVAITGRGFVNIDAVYFGDGNRVPFVVDSPTQIHVTAPLTANPGIVNISVQDIAQILSPITAATKFTYDPKLELFSISPASGPKSGGNSVVLTGTGFNVVTAVKFDTLSATFTIDSTTQITAKAPAHAAGPADIFVVGGGWNVGVNNGGKYVYSSGPTVTGLSPAYGMRDGGNNVTVTGTGFASGATVKFGSVSATGVAVNSATQITAKAPAGAGIVDVTVTVGGATSPATTASKYVYGNAPTVTGLSTTVGNQGSNMSISGTDFTGATAVKFGTTTARIAAVSPDSIIVDIPEGPVGQTVNVLVTTPQGTSSASTVSEFTFNGTPTISSISPKSGPAGGGTMVTITGTGFPKFVKVYMNNVEVQTNVTYTSTTKLSFVTPPGSDPAPVTVGSLAGTMGPTDNAIFTYTGGVSVTSSSPEDGPEAGGTVVTILGKGFVSGAKVKFGALAATSVTLLDSGRITATAPAGKGQVYIVVTNPDGAISATTNEARFLYLGKPVVTGIDQRYVAVEGGPTLTITGQSFTGATAVKFGNASSPNIRVQDGFLQAEIPPGTFGTTVDVLVVTPRGTSVANAETKLTYGFPPTVSSVSPGSGPFAGGTVVTVQGTGFTQVKSVKFGSTPAASFTVNSANQITATTAAAPAETVSVAITTAVGTNTIYPQGNFTYLGGPAVSTISPATGPATGGTSLTITGSGFQGASGVKFGQAAATSFTVNSDTKITAKAPAGSGVIDVSVVNGGVASAATTSSKFTYTGGATAPTVTSLSPTTGPAAGGTSVIITGTGFTGATAVKFGTVAATTFTVTSATKITAKAPAGSGVVDVTTTNAGLTSAVSAGSKFTYTGGATAPTITSLSPTTGPAAGGTSVIVTGTGFTGSTAVKFGTVAATTFTVTSATKITAKAPAGSGVVDVTVTNAGLTSAVSAGSKFTYTGGATAPTITSLSPTTGPAAGGTSVIITGTGFTGSTAVKFGTVAATTFTVTSATKITAKAPAGSGVMDVTVTNAGLTSAVSAASKYTYTGGAAAPTITSLSPTTGPAAGGTSVIITGTGFTGATAVKFGAVAATTFTVTSATKITAKAPAGSGVVDVTVTNAGLTSAVSAGSKYTYSGGATAPTVTGLSPTTGPAAGGTTVTITGTGFTGATAVKFGVKAATSFTVTSATKINAVSPSGSGAVDVTVIGGGVTSVVMAGSKFTYAGGTATPPSITRLSPATGAAAGGNSVTIVGSGFTGATGVKFGTVAATSFTVTSAARMSAVAPAGTGVVDVVVTTAGGSSAVGTSSKYTYKAATLAKMSSEGGVPTAANLRVQGLPTRRLSVDVSGAARGGPFVRANVVSVFPSVAGQAALVEEAAENGRSFTLDFTPADQFSGEAVVTYTIANATGESQPATVTIAVVSRPDPTTNPDVRGIVAAQTDAAIRFGDAQVTNFGRRLESLHSGAPVVSRNGVTLGFGFDDVRNSDSWARRQDDQARFEGPNSGGLADDRRRDADMAAQTDRAKPGRPDAMRAAEGETGPSAVSVWSGGMLQFGDRDARSGRSELRFNSSGISAGADVRLSEKLTLGAGAGFGFDATEVGKDGSRVEARNYIGAVYGSYRPVKGAFIDGAVGYGRLDFETRRAAAPGLFALADRSGDQVFAMVQAGWEWRGETLHLSPYARLSSVSGTLDAVSERGAGALNLHFASQSFESLKGALGGRGELFVPADYGVWVPRARVEYQREFKGGDKAQLSYADTVGGPIYSTTANLTDRNRWLVGLGAELRRSRSTFSVDVQTTMGGYDPVTDVLAKVALKF
jgi:uncharacterized protein YhjY with autotransporter beta-barrel domain